MKLDNEQVLCHSTTGHKSDSKHYSFLGDTKPFENKERPVDSTGLDTEGNLKENQNVVMHDINGNVGDSDPSPYVGNARDGWQASKIDSSVSINDYAKGNEKEVRDFVTSNSPSLKNMDSFQDSVFYLDKSVMECQLPELVVCYKESTYHVVKDICIDEGVPKQDKFLFESDMDEKSGCKFLPSENEQDGKLMKEKPETFKQDVSLFLKESQCGMDVENDCGSNKKLGTTTCDQDDSLFQEENESNKRISNECDSKDLVLTRELNFDAMKMISDDVSKELFTLGELFSLPEMSTVNSKTVSFDCKSDRIEQYSSQSSKEMEVKVMPPSVCPIEESNNSSEATVCTTALVSAVEEKDSGKGEAILVCPPHVSAPPESTSSSPVDEVAGDSKMEAERTTKVEDMSDQPIPNNLQRGTGETSFSAAVPVTGLISYSGPIAYSGSQSLRSDSSTTSTRSFAFPILQSEWNSSPVRMAKADRRHYRKHRGWRHGILCCRF